MRAFKGTYVIYDRCKYVCKLHSYLICLVQFCMLKLHSPEVWNFGTDKNCKQRKNLPVLTFKCVYANLLVPSAGIMFIIWLETRTILLEVKNDIFLLFLSRFIYHAFIVFRNKKQFAHNFIQVQSLVGAKSCIHESSGNHSVGCYCYWLLVHTYGTRTVHKNVERDSSGVFRYTFK